MEENKSWTHWFEIPASDFDRATKFYEEIFNVELHVDDFGSFKMAVFPHKEVGGAICWGDGYSPGSSGTLLYLDANPDLTDVLNKVKSAGGNIIQDKKQISPEHGFMALFTDCEGNRLALHSDI